MSKVILVILAVCIVGLLVAISGVLLADPLTLAGGALLFVVTFAVSVAYSNYVYYSD